jgi:hypothetical protein
MYSKKNSFFKLKKRGSMNDDSFILKVGFALVITLAIAIYYLSLSWEKYPHDNPVEEFIEKVVEKKTGIDIDLSPDSPEKA